MGLDVISSRANARVKQLRAAFQGHARLSGGMVAIEGDHLLEEALRSDFIQLLDAEREGHAALAAKLVDEDLVAGMALHVFKQEGRSAGSVFVFCDARVRPDFADAIGNLGNFKFRRNLFADALELAVFFECLDPVAQIVVGQSRAPNGGYRSSTMVRQESELRE